MDKKKKRTIIIFVIEAVALIIGIIPIIDLPPYIRSAYVGIMVSFFGINYIFWAISFRSPKRKDIINMILTFLLFAGCFFGMSYIDYKFFVHLSNPVYQVNIFDSNGNIVYTREFEQYREKSTSGDAWYYNEDGSKVEIMRKEKDN